MPEPVTEATKVEAIAAAITEAPLATFDLEFLAQDRLVPTLCLVQVSWLDKTTRLDVPAAAIVATPPDVALIDPLAVDVRPVIEALAAHPCVIAHAPRQDLGLLATRFGIAMPTIIDTQVMAAFAGIGDQVGLATLANELLDLGLGKDLQWTDWGRRPLSEAQLAYADADVRHLPAIFALLRARLGERLAWARAESSQVAADAVAASAVTPETAWQQLGGLRNLDAPALAAAIELAAWRLRTAIELDRPLGQVLNEKVLIDLARQRPSAPAALRSIKGISPIAKQRADELIAVIATAKAEAAPVLASMRSASQRAQRWSEMLVAIVQLIAEQARVAPRLLATRSDAEEFARVYDERGIEAASALPALATWRRDVIGRVWVDWLEGRIAMIGDPNAPSGIQLLPR
ncbi:MAG: HRDC domain-containing protein [Kofleriaceae bacterium]|nr:HRDC domain-containing protein [Kofleriaceae bacterium]